MPLFTNIHELYYIVKAIQIYIVNYIWLIDIIFEYNDILTPLFINYMVSFKKNNYIVNNTIQIND